MYILLVYWFLKKDIVIRVTQVINRLSCRIATLKHLHLKVNHAANYPDSGATIDLLVPDTSSTNLPGSSTAPLPSLFITDGFSPTYFFSFLKLHKPRPL